MLLHREKVCEPDLAVACRILEQGVSGVGLIAHDVTQRPAAAGPRVGEVPRALARVEAARPGREVVERHVDRRGEVGARRLGQDAHAPVVVLVGAGRRPGVVDRVDRDPRLPLAGELPRHARPQGVHSVHQQRVHVRLDRIEVGRQEEARAVRVLLVNVVHDLGMPHVVQRVDHQLRLDLREGVPVPVVVVPRVVVVQLGRVGPFGGGAERAVVPVRDDRHAVGVERRNEQQYHVLEDPAGGGAGVAREAVGEQRGRQVPTHLVRMDARGDEHDGAAVAQRLLLLAPAVDGARVGESGVELTVAVEVLQVGRARDHQRDERRAQRGLAELVVAHPVAGLRQRLVIAQQHGPVGEFPVLAGLEAEDRFRSGHAAGGGGGGGWGLRPARRPRTVALLCGERPRQGDEPRHEQGDERARRHAGQRNVPAAGGVSPPPSQCANHVRIRSSRSTSSHGGPVRDRPWYERG